MCAYNYSINVYMYNCDRGYSRDRSEMLRILQISYFRKQPYSGFHSINHLEPINIAVQ